MGSNRLDLIYQARQQSNKGELLWAMADEIQDQDAEIARLQKRALDLEVAGNALWDILCLQIIQRRSGAHSKEDHVRMDTWAKLTYQDKPAPGEALGEGEP